MCSSRPNRHAPRSSLATAAYWLARMTFRSYAALWFKSRQRLSTARAGRHVDMSPSRAGDSTRHCEGSSRAVFTRPVHEIQWWYSKVEVLIRNREDLSSAFGELGAKVDPRRGPNKRTNDQK